jgi:hypothetical protein
METNIANYFKYWKLFIVKTICDGLFSQFSSSLMTVMMTESFMSWKCLFSELEKTLETLTKASIAVYYRKQSRY